MRNKNPRQEESFERKHQEKKTIFWTRETVLFIMFRSLFVYLNSILLFFPSVVPRNAEVNAAAKLHFPPPHRCRSAISAPPLEIDNPPQLLHPMKWERKKTRVKRIWWDEWGGNRWEAWKRNLIQSKDFMEEKRREEKFLCLLFVEFSWNFPRVSRKQLIAISRGFQYSAWRVFFCVECCTVLAHKFAVRCQLNRQKEMIKVGGRKGGTRKEGIGQSTALPISTIFSSTVAQRSTVGLTSKFQLSFLFVPQQKQREEQLAQLDSIEQLELSSWAWQACGDEWTYVRNEARSSPTAESEGTEEEKKQTKIRRCVFKTCKTSVEEGDGKKTREMSVSGLEATFCYCLLRLFCSACILRLLE